MTKMKLTEWRVTFVASVYLWNTEFDLAEQAHSHFLKNETWCEKYPDIIKPYLLLAIAYDNTNFI